MFPIGVIIPKRIGSSCCGQFGFRFALFAQDFARAAVLLCLFWAVNRLVLARAAWSVLFSSPSSVGCLQLCKMALLVMFLHALFFHACVFVFAICWRRFACFGLVAGIFASTCPSFASTSEGSSSLFLLSRLVFLSFRVLTFHAF